MSTWALGDYPHGVKSETAAAATARIAASSIPQDVKDFCQAGVDALVAKHGANVMVTVKANGSLVDAGTDKHEQVATVIKERL